MVDEEWKALQKLGAGPADDQHRFEQAGSKSKLDGIAEKNDVGGKPFSGDAPPGEIGLILEL